MKAFVLEDYSQPPKVIDVPIPKPEKNEILVKVAYCGVNRVDLAVLSGRFEDEIKLPLIMGAEIVGTLADGKRVAVNPYLYCGKCSYCLKKEYLVCEKGRLLLGVQKNGGYAEYVCVPKSSLVEIPEGISFKEAASLIVSGGTAYRMVFTKAKINKDNWIAATAAGSGVGVYLCQFALLKTKKVIALAGSDEKLNKLNKLKKLGIRFLVNYNENNWQGKILEITQDQGINVLFDTVGGNILQNLLFFVSSLGQIITCGATENPNVNLNLIDLYIKQKTITGTSGFYNKDLTNIFNLAEKGKIKPIIDSIYPLTDIPQAWEKLKSRNAFGKILIKLE